MPHSAGRLLDPSLDGSSMARCVACRGRALWETQVPRPQDRVWSAMRKRIDVGGRDGPHGKPKPVTCEFQAPGTRHAPLLLVHIASRVSIV